MNVGELCTRRVATVRREDALLEAARRMRAEHVGALVVISEVDGKRMPVGVLTDRDIVVGVLARDASHLNSLDVGDVLLPEVVTASEDEDLEQVLRRMRSFGVRRVPVVDTERTLVGVLALDDILDALAEHVAEIASLVSRGPKEEILRRPT
jgi:CBS domain-containing protein